MDIDANGQGVVKALLQQELPVILTSLADMAQNWARSRSIWPFSYGLAAAPSK